VGGLLVGGGEPEPPALQSPAQHGLQAGLEERQVTGREPGDPLLVHVEAEHLEPEVGHAGGVGGAEIARSDDRQPVGQDLLLSLRCRRLAASLTTCPLVAAPSTGRRVVLAGSIRGMMDDFPAYAPSEEHELLRRTVRELADAKIAPFAAEVDEESRFPQEALDALAASGLHAVHVPESYGGAGADALATVIVIEEVARACASSSLIPAVNKLGTVPLQLAGSEELKQRYLAPVARGEAMLSYAMSGADARSDAARVKIQAVRQGDFSVLNGTKMWITSAGVSQFYTVMAVTDPSAGARGISAFVVEKSDAGVSFGPPERKLGIKGSPTRQVILEDVRIPAD